jgi:DNA-directed RNA polymerase specialized sigma subunit
MLEERIPDIERALLPAGLRSFIVYANNAEQLDAEEKTRILDAIAETALLKAAGKPEHADTNPFETNAQTSQEADRHRLAWSYMSLVLGTAHKWLARAGLSRLEDYIQNGIFGLYEAIEVHARSEKRYSFPKHAQPYVESAMRAQWLADLFGTDIGKGLQSALFAYLRASRAVQAGEKDRIDIDEVRKPAEASRDMMFGAMMLAQTLRESNRVPQERTAVHIDPDPFVELADNNPPLSPRMQIALALLSPLRQRALELRFGLGPDELVLSLEEIAKVEGMTSPRVARVTVNKALADLRIILANLDTHGTDFAKWKEQRFFKQNLNVLIYLHRAGVAIPMDKSLEHLRVIAMQDLNDRTDYEPDKNMVADMYGLHGGPRYTIVRLMQKYGHSIGYFSQVAAKVMRTDEVTHETINPELPPTTQIRPPEPEPTEFKVEADYQAIPIELPPPETTIENKCKEIMTLLMRLHQSAIRFCVDDLQGTWRYKGTSRFEQYLQEATFYEDLSPNELQRQGRAVQRALLTVMHRGHADALTVEETIDRLEEVPCYKKALIDGVVAFTLIVRTKRRLVTETLEHLPLSKAKIVYPLLDAALAKTALTFDYSGPLHFDAEAQKNITEALEGPMPLPPAAVHQ